MTMLITMITMMMTMMTMMTTLMIGKPMPEDGQLSAAWTAGEPEVIARCNNPCAIVQPLCKFQTLQVPMSQLRNLHINLYLQLLKCVSVYCVLLVQCAVCCAPHAGIPA